MGSRGRLLVGYSMRGIRHAAICLGLAGVTYVIAIPSHVSFGKGAAGSGSSGGTGGGGVGVGHGGGSANCTPKGNGICCGKNGSCHPATQPSKNSSGNSGGSTQPSGN
jgi:hypothetical protein